MIDITRGIDNRLPTWPGDTTLSLEQTSSINDGDSVNVSKLTMSTHTGTHVDAPWHYTANGVRLDEIGLERWCGTCLLVDARGARALEPGLLTGHDLAGVENVLFYSGQPNVWTAFPQIWAVVDPALPAFLRSKGIGLIGTDAPSADSLTSKDLPGHAALAQHDVLIIESLALEGVAPGRYRLICLPLKLNGADGAPARVVLEPLV
jgi:arylformamidase